MQISAQWSQVTGHAEQFELVQYLLEQVQLPRICTYDVTGNFEIRMKFSFQNKFIHLQKMRSITMLRNFVQKKKAEYK